MFCDVRRLRTLEADSRRSATVVKSLIFLVIQEARRDFDSCQHGLAGSLLARFVAGDGSLEMHV